MANLIDKLILLLCCSIFYLDITSDNIYFVFLILIGIALSAICSYINNESLSIIVFVIYLGFSIWIPELIYFIPLISYDVFIIRYKYLPTLILIPAIINYDILSSNLFISILFITIMGYLLKKRTTELHIIRSNYITFRDETKELSSILENKNKELMEKQDYEINLATLNERNRIARDIHDNIGHLLSSSLIQIGAITAISKEEHVRALLTNVNVTLSTGMTSIRESIHNIHEESMDLYSKLSSIIKDFTYCAAILDYKIEKELSIKAKYSIIFIVKETLSNVIKHSNATQVSIRLLEHPGLYQLIIQDNGKSVLFNPNSDGMGLSSIEDRVLTLGGQFNINKDNGFEIFISLPKGDIKN